MSDDQRGQEPGTAAGDADVEDALEDATADGGADDGSAAPAADEPTGSRPMEATTVTEGSDDDQPDDADGGAASDREVIEVAVPPNLLRAWEHRARKAKLSLSEYVVRMAEAGRMSVQMQPASAGGGEDGTTMTVEQLTEEIVERLRHEEAVSWDQLVDAISHNLEQNVEEALERLQEDDVVRYSGLEGGYRLVDEQD